MVQAILSLNLPDGSGCLPAQEGRVHLCGLAHLRSFTKYRHPELIAVDLL